MILSVDSPDQINGTVSKWISFLNEEVLNYFSNSTSNLNSYVSKFNHLITFRNKELSKSTNEVETVIETENINNETNPNDDSVNFSLVFPLIFIINISDRFYSFPVETQLQISLLLRSFAIKYNASLIYVDHTNVASKNRFINYISQVYFGLEEDVKVSLDPKDLFIPQGHDERSLAEKFLLEVNPNMLNTNENLETNKKEQDNDREEIISPFEFLRNVKSGKFHFISHRKDKIINLTKEQNIANEKIGVSEKTKQLLNLIDQNK